MTAYENKMKLRALLERLSSELGRPVTEADLTDEELAAEGIERRPVLRRQSRS